jgi:hypothetical protein
VEQLDDKGRCVQLLCFVPEGRLPTHDIMLAQKIAIEFLEDAVLTIASRFRTLEFTAGMYAKEPLNIPSTMAN